MHLYKLWQNFGITSTSELLEIKHTLHNNVLLQVSQGVLLVMRAEEAGLIMIHKLQDVRAAQLVDYAEKTIVVTLKTSSDSGVSQ